MDDLHLKGHPALCPHEPAAPPPDPRLEVTAHLPVLRALGLRLTGNRSAADDLVQETFLKALTHFHMFEPGSNMQAWLCTILRNTFFSNRRRLRHEVADPDGLHAAMLFELPDHDGRLALRDLHRAFVHLSPDHRAVILLMGAGGCSVEEAALRLGIARGTVKSRLSRARRRLADLMGMVPGDTAPASPQPAPAPARSGNQAQRPSPGARPTGPGLPLAAESGNHAPIDLEMLNRGLRP